MPQYITQQDIIDRVSADFFVGVSDRDGDQITDHSAVLSAIDDAEAEVNSYLGQRYSIPLSGVTSLEDPTLNEFPFILRRITSDIAIYRLANEHDRLTKEIRVRYEDSILWLEKVSRYEASLGASSVPATLHGGPQFIGPERIFVRDKMAGLV